MTQPFTPEQEARSREIVAEMIGQALNGTDRRLRAAKADDLADMRRQGLILKSMTAAERAAVNGDSPPTQRGNISWRGEYLAAAARLTPVLGAPIAGDPIIAAAEAIAEFVAVREPDSGLRLHAVKLAIDAAIADGVPTHVEAVVARASAFAAFALGKARVND